MEDIDHIFRKCCFAQLVWDIIVPSSMQAQFFNHNLEDWLINHVGLDVVVDGRKWFIIFVVILDNLWFCREKFIFDNVRHHPSDIIHHILRQADAIYHFELGAELFVVKRNKQCNHVGSYQLETTDYRSFQV